jgi:ATP-dependent Lon protease
MDDAAAPMLLFRVGPPAVGKMSVGQAIAERTGSAGHRGKPSLTQL